MPHPDLYRTGADLYDLLVSREDYLHRLIPAIESVSPFEGKTVVEAGAGTGRLTFLLAEKAAFVRAFDITQEMLKRAESRRRQARIENCSFARGDSRDLPVESHSADLAIEGWSILQMAVWEGAAWKESVARAVGEMVRVTRPGGPVVLIETLGTLREDAAGLDLFREHYRFFEEEMGFARTPVRTDYRFDSVAQAAELVAFFFGREMGDEVRKRDSVLVPECTGLWWRRA